MPISSTPRMADVATRPHGNGFLTGGGGVRRRPPPPVALVPLAAFVPLRERFVDWAMRGIHLAGRGTACVMDVVPASRNESRPGSCEAGVRPSPALASKGD